MNKRIIGIVFGLIVLAAVAGGYFWLWTLSRAEPENVAVLERYKPIEIESVKDDARDLLDDVGNGAKLPVSVSADRLGRDNPFLGL